MIFEHDDRKTYGLKWFMIPSSDAGCLPPPVSVGRRNKALPQQYKIIGFRSSSSNPHAEPVTVVWRAILGPRGVHSDSDQLGFGNPWAERRT